MCELFALSAEHPLKLGFSLNRFAQRGGKEAKNCDGWGVVTYQDQDVYVAREPAAAADSPLAQCLRTHLPPTHLMLAHLRQATYGAKRLCNTQPFIRVLGGRKQVFAHNGDIPDINLLEPPSAQWQPVGETDSEQAFCLLLQELATLWATTDPPTLTPILAKINAFATRLRPLGPANFLYADSEYLFVHSHERTQTDGKLGPPGLYMLEHREGDCPDILSDGVTTQCLQGNAIIIASVPLTEGDWQPLSTGELLVIRNGIIVSRT